jgi:hypothetical protein
LAERHKTFEGALFAHKEGLYRLSIPTLAAQEEAVHLADQPRPRCVRQPQGTQRHRRVEYRNAVVAKDFDNVFVLHEHNPPLSFHLLLSCAPSFHCTFRLLDPALVHSTQAFVTLSDLFNLVDA